MCSMYLCVSRKIKCYLSKRPIFDVNSLEKKHFMPIFFANLIATKRQRARQQNVLTIYFHLKILFLTLN